MTLEPSRPTTEPIGESMSSAAGSPAKTSALAEQAQESTASDPACGRNTPGSFAHFDPGTSSWKTFQLCLGGDWDEWSETWPRAGMTRSGIAFRLVPLVPITDVTGCSLLPTPAAHPAGWRNVEVVDKDGNPPTHANQRWYDKKTGRVVQKDLRHVIERGMWPTPDANRRGQAKNPNSATRPSGAKKQRSLEDAVATCGDRGPLNPTWVEWLMGFPIGWTDLGDSATQ
jgi:hypothetical protein